YKAVIFLDKWHKFSALSDKSN
ncbi:hypothetical protein A5834_001846, partial [Enterococcus faecium]